MICLATISRGGKLNWKFHRFGWQAVLTVEMRARQHLFRSSVYGKLMSSVMSIQSDHTVVHPESCCVYKVWVRGMQCESAVRLVSLPSRLEGLICTHSETALWLLYNYNPLHELLRLERVFGQISQAENVCKKALELTTHCLVAFCFVSSRLLSPRCWGVMSPHFRSLVSRIYSASGAFEHKRCGLILLQVCVFEFLSLPFY